MSPPPSPRYPFASGLYPPARPARPQRDDDDRDGDVAMGDGTTAATRPAASPSPFPFPGGINCHISDWADPARLADWAPTPVAPSTGPSRPRRAAAARVAPYQRDAPLPEDVQPRVRLPASRGAPSSASAGARLPVSAGARASPVPVTVVDDDDDEADGDVAMASVPSASAPPAAAPPAAQPEVPPAAAPAVPAASAAAGLTVAPAALWAEATPVEHVAPDVVGEELPGLWEGTWGDCFACVKAGEECVRVPGKPRCRRCTVGHGVPCDVDMTVPKMTGATGPLRMRVYASLLADWRANGVGRRRRPNPNIKLSAKTVGELPLAEEGLRRDVEAASEATRERKRARRRARSQPNRPAEAAQERRRTRAQTRGQPAEPATDLASLNHTVERAQVMFGALSEAATDWEETLRDVASVYSERATRPGGAPYRRSLGSVLAFLPNLETTMANLRAWSDALPTDPSE